MAVPKINGPHWNTRLPEPGAFEAAEIVPGPALQRHVDPGSVQNQDGRPGAAVRSGLSAQTATAPVSPP